LQRSKAQCAPYPLIQYNIKQQTVFKDAKQAILYALLIPVVENSISEKETIIRNAAAVCGGQDCCAL
jgi:hypothetical protein